MKVKCTKEHPLTIEQARKYANGKWMNIEYETEEYSCKRFGPLEIVACPPIPHDPDRILDFSCTNSPEYILLSEITSIEEYKS